MPTGRRNEAGEHRAQDATAAGFGAVLDVTVVRSQQSSVRVSAPDIDAEHADEHGA